MHNTNFFLDKQQEYKNLTVGEVAELLNKKDKGLTSFMHRVGRKLRGSASWFYKRGKELTAAIKQLGCPTFFATYSFADYHDPNLHSLFGSENADIKQKMKNVRDYPGIVTLYWEKKMQLWRQYYYNKILKTDWYWSRVEFQGRGSAHSHEMGKLKHDPDLVSLATKVFHGEQIEQVIKDKKQQIGENYIVTAEQRQALIDCVVAKKRIRDYADKLIKAMNNSPDFNEKTDQGKKIKNSYIPDPCAVRFCDIPPTVKAYEEQYNKILMTVQRHECKVGPTGCKRKKKGKKELECRFHFPKTIDPDNLTQISFSKNKEGFVRAKILIKTNDCMLNQCEKCQIMGHAANVDMQIMLDFHVAINYAAKYSCKGEKTSSDIEEVLDSIEKYCNYSDPGTKAWHKLMMKFAQQRNYSAQEVMFHNLSIPLVEHPNLEFQDVNLYPSFFCYVDKKKKIWKTAKSIVDVYAERLKYKDDPEFQNQNINWKEMNLDTFVRTFKVTKLSSATPTLTIRTQIKNKQQKQYHIINWIPEIQVQKGKNITRWYECELIKYKPWVTNSENVLPKNIHKLSGDKRDKAIKKYYREFIQKNKQNLSDNIINAEKLLEIEIEEVDFVEIEEFIEDEEGIFEFSKSKNNTSSDNTIYPTLTQADLDYDWTKHSSKYSFHDIQALQTWLESQKKIHTIKRKQKKVDINRYKHKQKKAYDIVKNHFLDPDNKKERLRAIFTGTAGTGKSEVIHGLRKLLGAKCKTIAPTGNTAFNIGGDTASSQLYLPIMGRRKNDITEQLLPTYRKKWPRQLEYLIIDEIGLIGQQEFAYIDRRLRQIYGNDIPFGGLNVILVGDFAQLPAIGDIPLWKQTSIANSNNMHRVGRKLYNTFDKAVTLTEIIRQDKDQIKFITFLRNLRNGICTKADWKYLQLRWKQNFSAYHLKKYDEQLLRLFARKKDRDQHNLKKLEELKQPVVRCVAENQDNVTKRATAKQAGGLWPVLHLAIGAKIRLGMNLWTEAGLYNGSLGTIKEIIYTPNTKPSDLPAVVLIEFPKYIGPNLELQGKTYKNVIPIIPQNITFLFGGKNRNRIQLPIQLAWGTTIHSSQGLTLDAAWIDLGKNEYAAGLSFVAFSRVKYFNECIIESMSWQRLEKCKNKNITERLAEEKRLLEKENEETLDIIENNNDSTINLMNDVVLNDFTQNNEDDDIDIRIDLQQSNENNYIEQKNSEEDIDLTSRHRDSCQCNICSKMEIDQTPELLQLPEQNNESYNRNQQNPDVVDLNNEEMVHMPWGEHLRQQQQNQLDSLIETHKELMDMD